MTENAKHSELSSRLQPSDIKKAKAWAELTSRYLDHLPGQLEGLRAFLDVKDFRKIKEGAHRIKGTSGTYRLSAISKGAAELEIFADKENAEGIDVAIKEMMRLIVAETNKHKSQAISTSEESEGPTNG